MNAPIHKTHAGPVGELENNYDELLIIRGLLVAAMKRARAYRGDQCKDVHKFVGDALDDCLSELCGIWEDIERKAEEDGVIGPHNQEIVYFDGLAVTAEDKGVE